MTRFSILLFCSIASAVPFTLLTRQAVPDDEVCKLEVYKASSWSKSGGEARLKQWIKDHGEEQWLSKMELEITGSNSNVDCSHIQSKNCNGPKQECLQTKEPSWYYVQQMASQVNSHLDMLHENLQSFVVQRTMEMDNILEDFEIKESDIGKILGIANGAAGIGSVIAGATGNAPAAAGLATLAGLLQIGGSVIEEPDQADLKTAMSDYLNSIFVKTEENVARLLLRLFGEDTEDKILDDTLKSMSDLGFSTGSSNEKSAIIRFLSSGASLEKLSSKPVQEALQRVFDLMRQGMIGALLAESKVYVLSNTKRKESDCKHEGMRYVDGACNELFQFDPRDQQSYRVPKEWYARLKDNYGFDRTQMYRNVIRCNNKPPGPKDSGLYPPCFFGLPVLRTDTVTNSAKDEWCSATNKKELPDWLNSDKGNWHPCAKMDEWIVPGGM
ncbi:hypothetical protein M011DRAFT_349716 [Sporormia fimetaria CBS 119925]|uniref:Uncharacterized protein n=1 Tax=Sporormia fimetaria CBS 119925 TaxID=1340428 RepID=A0A6A6VGY2_9PLEO|nr:hypothetical protein M011DRAFT_349716 [Sporormia fimetaria CBS 119925]